MANIPTLEQTLERFDDGDLITLSKWSRSSLKWLDLSDLCIKEQLVEHLKEEFSDILRMRVWRIDSNYGRDQESIPVHKIWVC